MMGFLMALQKIHKNTIVIKNPMPIVGYHPHLEDALGGGLPTRVVAHHDDVNLGPAQRHWVVNKEQIEVKGN